MVVVQVPPAVSEVRRLAVSRRRLWHLLCADARAVRLSVFSRAGLQQPCAVQRVWRHARVHVLCANLGIQTCHRLPCLQTPLRREGLAAMWMGRGLCNSLSLAARRMWSCSRRERRGRTVRGGQKVVLVGWHRRYRRVAPTSSRSQAIARGSAARKTPLKVWVRCALVRLSDSATFRGRDSGPSTSEDQQCVRTSSVHLEFAS